MKNYLIAIFLLLSATSFAQPGKKTRQEDKPPSQKEIEEMMKEMQNTMNEMSAEEKKMMDSMGIKMPSMKDLPQVSDKQLADAWEDENRIVPRRDAVRIAAIPKPIANLKMGAYITSVQNKVVAVLGPRLVSAGTGVYDYIKSNSKNAEEAANMAMGLWLAGKPELALYVLGKLCAADAANTDNLSNYSAMLSMMGAPHLAIPVLNNLNAKYPKNSTLLNNLGQAWFGLGEIGKAEKYLDSAIRIYAYHPQANLTKSRIEESKGNRQGAVEAAKRSIANAYTMEKENRLNKLGYKLQPTDIGWDKPMPQDALGLEKFKWPEYPMSVGESEILEVEWIEFRKKCRDEIEKLQLLEHTLEEEVEKANAIRTKQLLQAGQKGMMIDPLPRFAHKAMVKLNYLVDDRDGHIAYSYQKKGQAIADANMEIAKFEDNLSSELKRLEEEYEDQFGEGKPNPFDAACADDTKAKDRYLSLSNSLLRNAFNDFLAFMRLKINNDLYYYQYTMWPEQFELTKLQAKMSWLTLLSNQNPRFRNKSAWCQDKTDAEQKSYKLAEFDDIACQYKSSLNLGCLKLETNCSQTTTTYGCDKLSVAIHESGQNYTGATVKLAPKVSIGGNAGPLTVEGFIGGDATIELDENNNVKKWDGKVTTGIEAGVGISKGPVKVGATVKEALEVEIGSSGISDVNIVIDAKVQAGIKAPKSSGPEKIDRQINQGIDYVNKGIGKLNTKVEIGIESRTSLISGHGSLSGTGVLKDVKMSEW